MKTHDKHHKRTSIFEKNKEDPAKTDCIRIHVVIV